MSQIIETTWWLDWSALPTRLLRARLRVFQDGTAEVFDLDGKYHRFANCELARFRLCEDEYGRLANIIEDGDVEPELVPPEAVNDKALVKLMLVDRH